MTSQPLLYIRCARRCRLAVVSGSPAAPMIDVTPVRPQRSDELFARAWLRSAGRSEPISRGDIEDAISGMAAELARSGALERHSAAVISHRAGCRHGSWAFTDDRVWAALDARARELLLTFSDGFAGSGLRY